jgi:hypothetical protein
LNELLIGEPMQNEVRIGIVVDDGGSTKKVNNAADLLKKGYDDVTESALRANKAVKAMSAPKTTAALIVATTPVSASAPPIDNKDYGRVRGAVGTGAAGRDFAKQAQGLGGLVALYATFAANIFAVGAAYEALNKAAGTERLAKATEMMSISTGIHLKAVSKNLVEASGYALSFSEAMQFTNIGTSAGLASAQIESLTKIAKGAANALGRDVGDSVRRIIQGTAKQEQEILDELGIFVKASQAYEKFAAVNKIKVADMTGAQRTQAYANEVERLGKKWNEFAEIPDPFSKFAATGKNALNDLLTSINKVFTPLLSFLSESEGALKAIIVLISTSLTKRALPELGGLFSNIFNYDKKIQQANANAVVTSIRDRISQIANEIEIGNKKLIEVSKVPIISKESIARSAGPLAATPTRGSTLGTAGISTTRLSTNILGSISHPIDISKYKEVADLEKVTLKTLREQIKAKADQAGYTTKLIEQGLLDKSSKEGALVLGKEGLSIAQANFNVINAQNTALLASNTILADRLILEKASAKEQANLAKALPNSTLPANLPKSAAAATPVSPKAVAAATVAAETTAIEAAVVATNRKAVVDAYGAKVSSTYANATEQVTLALRIGTIPALKETAKQMGILLVENNLATIGTGFFANMQIVAAGASRILALALKGVGMAINWILTPLLIAVTVWQLFGDAIASFLPNSVQAALGIGEQGKAAEEATKKIKEYTEGTELAAMSLNKLNAARAAKPETFAESSSLNKIEATVVQEQIARIKKLNDIKQEAADKLKLEELKKRTGLEGTALLLQQLSESTTLTQEESKAVQQLTKDRAALDRAIKGNYVTEEARVSQSKLLQASENDLLNTIGIRTQQTLSSDEKLKSSNQTLEASYLRVVDALKKKGDPSLSLVTPEAVGIYNSLNEVFNSTSVTANKFEGTQATLIKMMQAGGTTAAAAAPLYSLLTDAIHAGSSAGRDGSLVTDLRLVNIYLEQQKDAIAKMVADLASTTDVKKVPKAIVPYDDNAKNLFAALKNDIDETALKMKQLTGKQDVNQALEARLTAINGVISAGAIATTKKLSDQQAELSYTKELIAAQDAYNKVVLDKSKVGPEGVAARKEAAEAYSNKAKELGLTKEQSLVMAEINEVTSLINKATTERNIELKKQADQEALSKGYSDLRLSNMEAELSYAIELGYMSSKEVVDAQGLLEIERQRQALKDKQTSLTGSYEASIAPLTATLTTAGAPEEQRQAAVTKILELYAGYQAQNLLIQTGAEGLATQTARTLELKSAQAGNNDEITKMVSITESLTAVFGDLGTNIGKAGEAILKMGQDEERLAAQKKAAITALGKDADPKKVAAIEIEYGKKSTKAELDNTAKIAGAAKGLFKEKSAGYKIMNAVEKVAQATSLALELSTMAGKFAAWWGAIPVKAAAETALTGVEAAGAAARAPLTYGQIIGQYLKSIPAPWGMVAGVAAGAFFLSLLGGGGGGGSEVNMAGLTSADRQEAQGTGQAWINGAKTDTGGGVFGDTSAKSESIQNSLNILTATSVEGLSFSNKQIELLTKIKDGIKEVAIAASGVQGIRTGSGFGTVESSTSNPGFLGLFASSSSTSIVDAGIKLTGTFKSLGESGGGLINRFETIATTWSKSGFLGLGGGSGTNINTNYADMDAPGATAADKKASQAIRETFTYMGELLVESGSKLNLSMEETLARANSLNIDITASLRGLSGKESQEELSAIFSSILDDAYAKVAPQLKKFRQFGEGFAETVTRVIDGFDKVNLGFTSMGLSIIEFAEVPAKATTAMYDAQELARQKMEDAKKAVPGIEYGNVQVNGHDGEYSIYTQINQAEIAKANKLVVDTTKAYNDSTNVIIEANKQITTAGFDLSESLIKATGGLEKFLEGTDLFAQIFLSEAQRLDIKKTGAANRLEEIGARGSKTDITTGIAQYSTDIPTYNVNKGTRSGVTPGATNNAVWEGVVTRLNKEHVDRFGVDFNSLRVANNDLQNTFNYITKTYTDITTQLNNGQAYTGIYGTYEGAREGASNTYDTNTVAADLFKEMSDGGDSIINTKKEYRSLVDAAYEGSKEVVAAEDTIGKARRQEYIDLYAHLMDPALLTAQQAIWDAEESGATTTSKLFGLETDLLKLRGRTYEATLRERGLILEELALEDKTVISTQEAIFAQEDLNKTRELELELLSAQGNSSKALLMTRERELLALSASDGALKIRIWQLQDETKLIEQRNAQESTIYTLLGNSAAALQITREKELATMDEQLKPAQKYIYALQDEANIKAKLKTAYDREKTAIKSTIDSISGFIKSLNDTKSALLVGDKSTLTPGEKYAEAKRQAYAIAAIATGIATTDAEILARNDAVSKLPSVTGTFLDASRQLYASSEQYTKDFNAVLGMLDTTTSSLSAQQTDAEKQLEILSSSDNYLATIASDTTTSAEYLQQLAENLPILLAAKDAAAASGSMAAGATSTTNPITSTTAPTNRSIINNAYKQYLNRDAEEEVAAWWEAKIPTVGIDNVIKGIANSNEAKVQLLYSKLAGRVGEHSGVNFWLNVLSSGSSSQEVVWGFAKSVLSNEPTNATALANKIASGSLQNAIVPGFAKGGLANGMAMVGEQGPELVDFKTPTRVYSNTASNQLLNNKELIEEIRNLRSEVSSLRKEQKEQTGHLIATNYDANNKSANSITEATEQASVSSNWNQRSQVKLA